ncbi:DUF397 domain-containing protein [Streptomyces syringium]|uniref:DUF397 domain-containing protein n=1 Tax=Streptomyces syringium TaxID=76729 RepID=UPI0033A7E208
MFKKSSHSSGVETCVEIALPEALDPVAIRDSKHPDGPILWCGPRAYRSFTRAVRAGELRPRVAAATVRARASGRLTARTATGREPPVPSPHPA